jgi:hypothetical protein
MLFKVTGDELSDKFSDVKELSVGLLPLGQPVLVADQIMTNLNKLAGRNVILQHQLTEFLSRRP